MITDQFRIQLEEFHERRFFPQKYPDPYQEFIDFINQETVDSLIEESEAVAYYIYSIIPVIKFRDQFNSYSRAIQDKHPGFFDVRNAEDSQDVWQKLKDWTTEWNSVLQDWLQEFIAHERKWKNLMSPTHNLEQMLRETVDLFSWKLSQRTQAKNLPVLLNHFRLKAAAPLADWNDFPALARSYSELCRIYSTSNLRKSEDPSVMQCFPIRPPDQIQLQYGSAAGPLDVIRFAAELAQSWFYSGMNPELPVENRICGDPQLPLFWGYLYSLPFSTTVGLGKIVHQRTEIFASELRLAIEFFLRYDALLALFRSRVDPSLKEAEDLYVYYFQTALPLQAPSFLYLYDLDRSTNAIFRMLALRGALAVEEKLLTQFGRDWFSSSRLVALFKDYWREGFRLSLEDVLRDLDVSIPDSLLFSQQ